MLGQLMKSDADVVYDKSKGKLFLNENDAAKRWGEKKIGGLVTRFKSKPELSADYFDGLTAHSGDAITGSGEQQSGDIKYQIAFIREVICDEEVYELYGEMLVDHKKGLKSIAKAGKKEGYEFGKAELGEAVDEMDDAGGFSDVELDDAALIFLLGMGGEQQQISKASKS